jgi:predicted metal-dependent hydrolase
MLALAEREVPLRVRESARARRITVRIDAGADSVELVLPRRVSLAAGLRFLDARRDWLAAHLAEMPEHVAFADGAIVPVLGTPHRIRHLGERVTGARTVTIADGEIRVVGAAPHVARRVRDHLIALARHELSRRARALAARIDRRVARISVRDTRSRWGSCSASGVLAFSWRLILAPEAVLDYVVAHEVAHLAEMNHGPRFWRVVEMLSPGSARQRGWLSRNRARLLRYG